MTQIHPSLKVLASDNTDCTPVTVASRTIARHHILRSEFRALLTAQDDGWNILDLTDFDIIDDRVGTTTEEMKNTDSNQIAD
jgi:hypothetical protein